MKKIAKNDQILRKNWVIEANFGKLIGLKILKMCTKF